MRTLLSGAMMSLWLLSAAANAADECAFKWDIHREHALFAGAAKLVTASSAADSANALELNTLYEVRLPAAETLKYDVPPGKKMLTDGTFGGMLAFEVRAPGAYRVALDGPFWIDVVANHQLTATKDFGGPQSCPGGPRKLVEYELKAGSYLLQISGASVDQIKVAITPSAPNRS